MSSDSQAGAPVTIDSVEHALSAFQRLPLPLFARREASVLVPLTVVDGEIRVLFTRRSPTLSHHPGEISFPGGAVEPEDSDSRAAALREAVEETGLDPSCCRFLGTLDDAPTVTGFRITPHVVACTKLPDASPSDLEVEGLFSVPLRFFLESQPGYEIGIESGGTIHRSPMYNFQGSVIWGATARIVRDLCAVVRGIHDDDGTDARLRRLGMRLLEAKKVLLTTHVNPDPDGIGAQLAVEEMLLAAGKDVVIVNHHPIPPRFSFLCPKSLYVNDPAGVPQAVAGVDFVLVLDTAEKARAGHPARVFDDHLGRIGVIDHHLAGDLKSPITVMDSHYSSTSEIVLRFLGRLGFRPTKRCADALLAGIMFDTHSFRFINNTPTALRAAAFLLEAGADATTLQDRLFAQVSMGHARVLGHAMSRVRLEMGNAFMWSWITKDEMQQLGATGEDAGDVSAYFVTVEGVKVALYMRETAPGTYKLSFRSRDGYPIGDICISLGGGGHANAGGATVNGDPEEIVSKFRGRVEAMLGTKASAY